jgi:hypothetical protein
MSSLRSRRTSTVYSDDPTIKTRSERGTRSSVSFLLATPVHHKNKLALAGSRLPLSPSSPDRGDDPTPQRKHCHSPTQPFRNHNSSTNSSSSIPSSPKSPTATTTTKMYAASLPPRTPVSASRRSSSSIRRSSVAINGTPSRVVTKTEHLRQQLEKEQRRSNIMDRIECITSGEKERVQQLRQQILSSSSSRESSRESSPVQQEKPSSSHRDNFSNSVGSLPANVPFAEKTVAATAAAAAAAASPRYHRRQRHSSMMDPSRSAPVSGRHASLPPRNNSNNNNTNTTTTTTSSRTPSKSSKSLREKLLPLSRPPLPLIHVPFPDEEESPRKRRAKLSLLDLLNDSSHHSRGSSSRMNGGSSHHRRSCSPIGSSTTTTTTTGTGTTTMPFRTARQLATLIPNEDANEELRRRSSKTPTQLATSLLLLSPTLKKKKYKGGGDTKTQESPRQAKKSGSSSSSSSSSTTIPTELASSSSQKSSKVPESPLETKNNTTPTELASSLPWSSPKTKKSKGDTTKRQQQEPELPESPKKKKSSSRRDINGKKRRSSRSSSRAMDVDQEPMNSVQPMSSSSDMPCSPVQHHDKDHLLVGTKSSQRHLVNDSSSGRDVLNEDQVEQGIRASLHREQEQNTVINSHKSTSSGFSLMISPCSPDSLHSSMSSMSFTLLSTAAETAAPATPSRSRASKVVATVTPRESSERRRRSSNLGASLKAFLFQSGTSPTPLLASDDDDIVSVELSTSSKMDSVNEEDEKLLLLGKISPHLSAKMTAIPGPPSNPKARMIQPRITPDETSVHRNHTLPPALVSPTATTTVKKELSAVVSSSTPSPSRRRLALTIGDVRKAFFTTPLSPTPTATTSMTTTSITTSTTQTPCSSPGRALEMKREQNRQSSIRRFRRAGMALFQAEKSTSESQHRRSLVQDALQEHLD